jgi:predicted nucleic acid-binding protein
MAAALLDTNAVSDLMRDHPHVKARMGKHPDAIGTSVVVAGEIRYGLERLPAGKKRSGLEARAQSVLSILNVEHITEPIARSYGRLKASVEGQGLNLDDNDLWIAATAMTLGNLLVSRDQIFAQVPGLHVEDWSV